MGIMSNKSLKKLIEMIMYKFNSHTHKDFEGATASQSGESGFVPTPPPLDDSGRYLRSDGTWQHVTDATADHIEGFNVDNIDPLNMESAETSEFGYTLNSENAGGMLIKQIFNDGSCGYELYGRYVANSIGSTLHVRSRNDNKWNEWECVLTSKNVLLRSGIVCPQIRFMTRSTDYGRWIKVTFNQNYQGWMISMQLNLFDAYRNMTYRVGGYEFVQSATVRNWYAPSVIPIHLLPAHGMATPPYFIFDKDSDGNLFFAFNCPSMYDSISISDIHSGWTVYTQWDEIISIQELSSKPPMTSEGKTIYPHGDFYDYDTGLRTIDAVRVDCINDYGSGVYAPIFASAFTQQSSAKFKSNIQDMPDEMARNILKYRVVTFDYKNEGSPNNCEGVIAEEVNEINPYPVVMDENGEPYGIDYSKFVPELIRMIQLQQDQINSMQEEIDKLKTEVNNK